MSEWPSKSDSFQQPVSRTSRGVVGVAGGSVVVVGCSEVVLATQEAQVVTSAHTDWPPDPLHCSEVVVTEQELPGGVVKLVGDRVGKGSELLTTHEAQVVTETQTDCPPEPLHCWAVVVTEHELPDGVEMPVDDVSVGNGSVEEGALVVELALLEDELLLFGNGISQVSPSWRAKRAAGGFGFHGQILCARFAVFQIPPQTMPVPSLSNREYRAIRDHA